MIDRLHRLVARLRKAGVLSFVLFAFVLFSFRSAVADWYDVPSGSMLPTLEIGDRIAVNKLAYDVRIPFTDHVLSRWGSPARGEVVTLPSPADGKRLVKRVCAIAGDVVQMKDGRLILDGVPVAYEPLVEGRAREHLDDGGHVVQWDEPVARLRDFGPIRVPVGQLLVMGDNRDHSADSRVFGFAPVASVEGRVSAVAFSLDHDRYYLPKSDRWWHAID